jgi:hypothetical protein
LGFGGKQSGCSWIGDCLLVEAVTTQEGLLEPNFAKLSFERAVQLFQGWGFRVEEGPGHEEVTLILEGPAHRSSYVYEVAQLPQIAAAVLRVRWNTGAIMAPVLDV